MWRDSTRPALIGTGRRRPHTRVMHPLPSPVAVTLLSAQARRCPLGPPRLTCTRPSPLLPCPTIAGCPALPADNAWRTTSATPVTRTARLGSTTSSNSRPPPDVARIRTTAVPYVTVPALTHWCHHVYRVRVPERSRRTRYAWIPRSSRRDMPLRVASANCHLYDSRASGPVLGGSESGAVFDLTSDAFAGRRLDGRRRARAAICRIGASRRDRPPWHIEARSARHRGRNHVATSTPPA